MGFAIPYAFVLIAVAAACVPPQAYDPFQARVAAGCESLQSCKVLAAEADARWTDCHNANLRDYWTACAAQTQDRDRANRMLDAQVNAAANADRRARAARFQRESELLKKYESDEKSLGDSCKAIAILESAADTIRQEDPNGVVALRYADLARTRRSERVRLLTHQFQAAITAPASPPEADQPSDLLAAIPRARALVDSLGCYDADAAARARVDVDSWASALELAVADEQRCRGTPACMGARVATPLCGAIDVRRGALQGIARERANPAGVVNLTTLHELGQAVQDNDETISDLKAKYLAIVHHPFDERTCQKSPR